MAQEIIDVGGEANDGTGEPLRQAFEAVNNNFSQIFSAGPVDSNIVISGNTISVTGINNNLVLQANGVGSIQANSTILPSIDSVYDIGSPTKRMDTVHAAYFSGNGSQLTGVVASAGSFIANGTSNISISDANGPVTIRVGPTSNALVITSSGLSAAGNVAGNYILGNGALLTA